MKGSEQVSNKYSVNYHSGITYEFDNVCEAMKFADNNAGYSQRNITIEDKLGNTIAERTWYGCKDRISLCENPISFGDFGFYDDWCTFDVRERLKS